MGQRIQRILIVGRDARAHALAWKLSQSEKYPVELFFAPGNAGTSALGENIGIEEIDIERLLEFAELKKIDFTIVGPDNALAAGIVDAFLKRGFRIFGPTKVAARIESSKAFAKLLMAKCHVPSARYKVFRREYIHDATRYVSTRGLPLVVKANGLALGKGVYVCHTFEDAKWAIENILARRIHGDAGNEIIIEDFISGPELSLHAFCDGENYVLFPAAQDHKALYEGGPNTGGMGAIAPVPWVSTADLKTYGDQVYAPILRNMHTMCMPFHGCLFAGVIVTEDGPVVIEYNARFGDPEAQVFALLFEGDLLPVLEACSVCGGLKNIEPITWRPGFAVCVVLVSKGYPGTDFERGMLITGIADAEKLEGVKIFHAGTENTTNGMLRTSGGRVLNVTAVGSTLEEARARAYAGVDCIHFEGKEYRKDIGSSSLAMM